ncbi:hypothetical protein [Streptomyces rimosus]|uniref:hypothetical protein n=1 Tax=Streptomyces rimosus TaxID=1927 RepID=UPI0037ABFFA9
MGDLSSFAPFAGGLNAREVTRLLLYRPRYSTNTVFTGIHRLTERATAHFGGALFLRPRTRPAQRHTRPGLRRRRARGFRAGDG